MAWEKTVWACGHTGSMQLYGKMSGRDATVAKEAGRKCMACWLVGEWEAASDPRAKREDRYKLAAQIAENKGKRIDVPDSMPVLVHPTTDLEALKLERTRLIARIAEIDAIITQ